MLRNKARVLFMIALSLTFGVLSACGGGASSGTSQGSGSDAKPASDNKSAPATASAKPAEFSFYFTGSQNVKDLWDTLIPMFEKATPDVKVKPVYVPSGTGAQPTYDRILAAKQAGKGSGDIDLYEDGVNYVTRGQKDDLWDTLGTDKIPNLAKVDQKIMKDVANLAVPYRSSAVILAYNGDKVKDAPTTLDELYDWIRKHPGKFAYNDPSTGGSGDSFVTTAIYKFLPEDAIHNSDPAIEKQWDQGFALLKDLGKYVYGKGIYPKKNQGTLDLLASGEVDMIPAWSDMVLDQINKGQLPKSTKMAQLKPGFNGGPTYLMVPKLSANKDAVAKFLNFILTPEAQSVIVTKMSGFPGIQLANMPQEVQDKFKDAAAGFRTFNIGDLGKDISKRWQSEVAAQ
ncbi:ABC transporter substrate-binding protein [Gordoniibacillus kamchatkensis]|uniref:ABC transporter substrate-binding protein n=1 Tax=Gordoniibacillus kamchatkensis TaxID=1590651 RepID=A0ABR5ABZ1_9BACL|nr:extracellular solute-binding protein [Paenibacillus sp. VKM B-2647]KIL38548.1 ABC transporter substrate-binding protein [Paenibacillus sp. VKM B-2647]